MTRKKGKPRDRVLRRTAELVSQLPKLTYDQYNAVANALWIHGLGEEPRRRDAGVERARGEAVTAAKEISALYPQLQAEDRAIVKARLTRARERCRDVRSGKKFGPIPNAALVFFR